MFFSKLARILAIVGFVIGLLVVLLATSTMGFLDEAVQARYVGRSLGNYIDLGAYTVLAAVALGTLAEISITLRRW